MCAVRLVRNRTLWRTLTGGDLVVNFTSVIKRQRLSGGVIHITPPWCIGSVGTSVPANLAPVVQRDSPWPARGPIIIAGQLIGLPARLPAASRLSPSYSRAWRGATGVLDPGVRPGLA